MKRQLVMALGSAALMAAVSSTARADAFLSLNNGATTLSCNTSLAFNAGNCGAGFTAVLGGSTIDFTGAVGGYALNDLRLGSNTPGTPVIGFVGDSKNLVGNVSAGATALTVSFAVNNFNLPAGSPLTLSAAQSATFIQAAAGTSQAFTGWGNSANTLATSTGTAVVTPLCVNPAAAPPVNSCSEAGVPVLFTRSGLFALNGVEVINLNQGGVASFQGGIAVTPPTTVPEPGTYALMATGLLALVGGRRVMKRKA